MIRLVGIPCDLKGGVTVKTTLSVAVMLAAAACMGCANNDEFTSERPILVFPQPENTFDEDLSARKPYSAPPSWLYKPDSYPNKRAGCTYFVGIGLPRATVQDARESAFEDAQRQIVRYMGTTVGVKTERTGTAHGDTRGGAYETMTDQIFSSSISKNTVRNLYVRDQYYTAGMMVQDIAKRRVNLAYVLVEFGATQALGVAEKAKGETKKQIQTLEKKRADTPAKILDSRDASRLESLKRLEKKLDNLSIDDFKL